MNAYLMPLTGGVLLGLSAMWLLLSLGRIAGISGIAWGSFAGPERGWRWLFLVGLLGGGLAAGLSAVDAYGWSIPLGAVLGRGIANNTCK